MKLKKVTMLECTGNVYAAVVDCSTWTDLGAFWCPPDGSPGGTIIKIELVLDVPNTETVGYPK